MNEVLLEIGNLFSPSVVQERELEMHSASLKSDWGVDTSVLVSEQQDNVTLLRLSERYRSIREESSRLDAQEVGMVTEMMGINAPSGYSQDRLARQIQLLNHTPNRLHLISQFIEQRETEIAFE